MDVFALQCFTAKGDGLLLSQSLHTAFWIVSRGEEWGRGCDSPCLLGQCWLGPVGCLAGKVEEQREGRQSWQAAGAAPSRPPLCLLSPRSLSVHCWWGGAGCESLEFDLALALWHLKEMKDAASENWWENHRSLSEVLMVLIAESSYIIHAL